MKEKDTYRNPFLKDKLASFQVDPPEQVWQDLSARLPGNKGRRRELIIVLAAAASLALAVSLGILLYQPAGTGSDQMAEDQSTPAELQADAAAADQSDAQAAVRIADQQAEKAAVKAGVGASDSDLNKAVIAQLTVEEAAGDKDQAPPPELSHVEVARDLAFVPTDSLAPGKEVKADVLDQKALEQQLLDAMGAVDEPVIAMKTKSDRKWSVGAGLSPLYSYRAATMPVSGTTPSHESGLLAYSGGVAVAYSPVSRLSIESGIYYNRTGVRIGEESTQLFGWGKQVDFTPSPQAIPVRTITNSIGNMVLTSGDVYVNTYKTGKFVTQSDAVDDVEAAVGTVGYTQHLDYLEWPLNLRYAVIDRKLGLQVLGGVSANFLVSNYLTTEGANGTEVVGYMSNLNRVNYSGNTGVALIYKIGARMQLNMEPRFRYFINSVNDESLPQTNPWSFGLYTGLNFRF